MQTNVIANQEPAASDSTTTTPTAPVANETDTENNNSTNPVTSSPSPDTGNSASTPVAVSDNQTTGNPTTTAASSEQPETNIIVQGTWGTSKWDYTQESDDYILHLHAGTLGTPGKIMIIMEILGM